MHNKNHNNLGESLLENLLRYRELKALDQTAKQTEQTAKEVRRLRDEMRESAERDAKERQAEETRIAELPKCPICGVPLEGQFRKCMHCMGDVSWVEGIPCEPGQVQEVQERLRQEWQAEQQRAEESKRARNELKAMMHLVTKGLPDNCPICRGTRPGFLPSLPVGYDVLDVRVVSENLLYAEKWAASMSNTGRCYVCVWNEKEARLTERANAKSKANTVLAWLFGIVLVVFVYYLIVPSS